MSNYVKAKMSFYHDSVGSKGQNEMFEVKDEKTMSELEQAGYVQRIEGQEAQQMQSNQEMQQKVGQHNALTNEAVSLASHVQNVQANSHNETVKQLRQQMAQKQQQQGHDASRNTARKANEK